MSSAAVVSLLFVASLAFVTADRDYIAAVYQHSPYVLKKGWTPMDLWKRNLDVYDEQTRAAADKGADIIVFPEVGITGNLLELMANRDTLEPVSPECRDPEVETWISCDRPDVPKAYPLERLSCMAKENNIYVVAGLITSAPCAGKPGCPADGRYSYNTAVVFDRRGKLVFRYYKTHLFFEVVNNVPQEAQIPVFDTDFGRFGLCICFDSVFKFPMVDLIQKVGIKNVLFPTFWVDEYTPALVWQQGFAAGNNVNFLAANAHSELTTGGGIFSGKDVLQSVHGQPKLLIAKVPVGGPRTEIIHNCHICTTASDPVQKYTIRPEPEDTFYGRYFGMRTKFTPLVKDRDNITVCEDGLCCTLSYKVRSNPNDELYAFGVGSGHCVLKEEEINKASVLNLEHKLFMQVCTVMKCPDRKRDSCGVISPDATTTFDSFEIKGNFSSQSLYPSVVNDGMTFPGSDEWYHCPGCGRLWSETGTKRPLVSASFTGRAYERDEVDPRMP